MITVTEKPLVELTQATIRFCGDSGDGMQLAGTQFTNTSALLGNDISTFPDFPAEIRAPAGTLAGVSGFQVHFIQHRHLHARRRPQRPGRHEPGRPQDQPQGRWNRAASSSSTRTPSRASDLHKAGYAVNPLEDGSLKGYRLISRAGRQAQPRGRRRRQTQPARGRPLQELLRARPGLLAVRTAAGADAALDPRQVRQEARRPARPTSPTLKAGYNYGETVEALPVQYQVAKAKLPPGTLSQDHRQRSDGHRPGRRRRARRTSRCVYCQLSDHARQRHPASPGRA